MSKEAYEFLLTTTVVKSNAMMAVFAATLSFFFGFASLVAFSPSVAVVAPLLNMTSEQRGALIASPTVTGALLRVPFSVLAMMVGTRRLFVVAQSVGTAGLAGLLILIFATVGQGAPLVDSYAGFVLFGLLTGVAAASHAVGVIHVSFWSPASRQATSIGVFQGLGSAGSSVFALIVPFMIEGAGLSVTYLIWSVVSAATVIFMLFALRDPPYQQIVRFIGLANGKVSYPHEDGYRSTASEFQAARESSPEDTWQRSVLVRGEMPDWTDITFGFEEIKNLCSLQFRTANYPSGSLLRSIAAAATSWRVWILFVAQLSSFGVAYLAVVIWSPTFWIGAFGATNIVGGALSFGFSLIGTVVRAPVGVLVDKINPHSLGFFSSLLQFAVTINLVFSTSFGLSIFLIMFSAVISAFANTCVWKCITIHERTALSGAIGILSLGVIGGAIVPPIMGSIVSANTDPALGLRLGMAIPAAAGLLQAACFLTLWVLPSPLPTAEIAWNKGTHFEIK